MRRITTARPEPQVVAKMGSLPGLASTGSTNVDVRNSKVLPERRDGWENPNNASLPDMEH